MTKTSAAIKIIPKSALQKILGTRMITIPPNLAMVIGVTNSICWQQVNYWVSNESCNDNIFEGRRWVYNTYTQWREQLPFFSEITIKRSLLELEKMGLILVTNKGNKKYYTVDYDALELLLTSDITGTRDQDQNDPYQNDPVSVSKRYAERIKMIRSYIDTKSTHRLPLEKEAHSANAPPSLSNFSDQKKEKTPSSTKGTRLPQDWEIPNEWREWLLGHGVFNEQIDLEAEKFKNYWLSTAKNATKVNWFMTWKNWCYSNMERSGKNIKILTPKPIAPPQEQSYQRSVSNIPKSSDPKIQRWHELQHILRNTMGENDYDSWIVGNLELIKIGATATFRVKSLFCQDWIKQHYISVLASVLSKIDPLLVDERKIEFVIGEINPKFKLENNSSCQEIPKVVSPVNNGSLKSIGHIVNNINAI